MFILGKLHPRHSSLAKWSKIFFHKLKSIPMSYRNKSVVPSTNFSSSMEVPNQLKQVFNLIDFNGDGKISPLELGELLIGLGHEKSSVIHEAEEILREADQNGDGFIDFDEFLHVVEGENGSQICGSDEDLMEAFRVFDVDKNGYISAEELRKVLVGLRLGKCSLRQCRLMIRGVDRNGDGVVDFEEFRAMMTSAKITGTIYLV